MLPQMSLDQRLEQLDQGIQRGADADQDEHDREYLADGR
jgi:hypothetical protein